MCVPGSGARCLRALVDRPPAPEDAPPGSVPGVPRRHQLLLAAKRKYDSWRFDEVADVPLARVDDE